MAVTSLSVFEHTDIPVAPCAGPGTLSESEADHLCWLSEECRGFCDRGYRSVKFAQFCGLVNLGERVLEILPKVGEKLSRSQSRGVLLRMLGMSPDFPLYRQSTVGQANLEAPLLDVFIRAFFDEVTGLMKGGLLHRYLELEEDCLAVRGSIHLGRQLSAMANRTDRIACRYDELTSDNRWNRLIKAGLRAVRPWMHSVDLQRSWVELMNGFDGVTDIADARPMLSGLCYDRQGNRYRPAIEWVERILSLLSPNLRAGERAAPGLLFDMNRLFEGVVTQRLEGWASNRGWALEAQNSKNYFAEIAGISNRKAFKVRPDLLFTRRGHPIALADAKWKHPKLSGTGFILPDQADLYQLHAYASVFLCSQLALIYPWDDALIGACETIFRLPHSDSVRPQLTILCLDVARDDLPFIVRGDDW